MRLDLLCCGVAALAVAASSASAQLPPELQAFIRTPAHRAEIAASVRPYLADVPSCQAATTRSVSVNIYTPPTFASDGSLTGGVFKENIKIDGCATSGALNILTMFRPGAPPLVGMLLPGDTHADIALQRDALVSARALVAGKTPAGCGALHVIDTHFDGYGEPVNADVPAGRDARQWRETWTFFSCGQQTAIHVDFFPTHTGTHFVAAF
ncbi:hypothetical protein [Phenylobacterium sp.]|uniref:hypothetical protein n=1 Tax=Phenylobacterium sp. TaxID=1871053 RepID=UPI002F401331